MSKFTCRTNELLSGYPMAEFLRNLGGLFALLFFLSACGAPLQRTAVAVGQTTGITLVSESLVGSEVFVDGQLVARISRENLERYPYGILTSKRHPIEKQERFMVAASPGDQVVRVSRNGRIELERQIYLVEGQLREITF